MSREEPVTIAVHILVRVLVAQIDVVAFADHAIERGYVNQDSFQTLTSHRVLLSGGSVSEKVKGLQRVVRIAVAGLCALVALLISMSPALAQFGNFERRGGVFGSFFDPFSEPRYELQRRYEPRRRHKPKTRQRSPKRQIERQIDHSRAPAPRELDTEPPSLVLVLGDSMADWLAYGLEDALSDLPEMGVVRKPRAGSGLLVSDARDKADDWAHVAREAIAATRPKFIVMMVGLNDRQAIHLRMPPPTSRLEKPGSKHRLQTYEFRSEPWAKQYSKVIDATIAALKSGEVPVFWMGLPSIRGSRSSADALYLNELYRSRAEKAGINYVDVWDGFVGENDRYTAYGPDFEGQVRRLRVRDGVHFTKAGARKLAFYVDREIRRAMSRGVTPIALPASEALPDPIKRPDAPLPRPLAGPVLPLTGAMRGQTHELLGAGATTSRPKRHPLARRVLEKGEAMTPPAGRSDDFIWPRRDIASYGSDPAVVTTRDPIPPMRAVPPTMVPVPRRASR